MSSNRAPYEDLPDNLVPHANHVRGSMRLDDSRMKFAVDMVEAKAKTVQRIIACQRATLDAADPDSSEARLKRDTFIWVERVLCEITKLSWELSQQSRWKQWRNREANTGILWDIYDSMERLSNGFMAETLINHTAQLQELEAMNNDEGHS